LPRRQPRCPGGQERRSDRLAPQPSEQLAQGSSRSDWRRGDLWKPVGLRALWRVSALVPRSSASVPAGPVARNGGRRGGGRLRSWRVLHDSGSGPRAERHPAPARRARRSRRRWGARTSSIRCAGTSGACRLDGLGEGLFGHHGWPPRVVRDVRRPKDSGILGQKRAKGVLDAVPNVRRHLGRSPGGAAQGQRALE
jgi:hypothetical protein